jgi:hypothetical protein
MQSVGLLALMESANWVPICFPGYDALAIPWGVPVPGLTGFANISHRAHNIVELISLIRPKSARSYAASAGTFPAR